MQSGRSTLLTLAAILSACGTVEDHNPDAAPDDAAPPDAAACTDDRTCATGYGCDPAIGCVPRYGKSADRPGTSCADILRVLVTAADGRYWIDPDGGAPDNAFEAHCDMTTDGGGWTLVYKYVGKADQKTSQLALLAPDFAGPAATSAPLRDDRVDAINRRVHEAFLMAKGRSWMSTWILYDQLDDHEIDRNVAVFDLDAQLAWNDVYTFSAGCTKLPGKLTLRVFDDATRKMVTVGASSYRFVANTDGRGFLAADTSQASYADTCMQAAGNLIQWPAGLKFDTTLDLSWDNTIAHLWYQRTAATRDKDRCAWKCWRDELLYSGREWYVR